MVVGRGGGKVGLKDTLSTQLTILMFMDQVSPGEDAGCCAF